MAPASPAESDRGTSTIACQNISTKIHRDEELAPTQEASGLNWFAATPAVTSRAGSDCLCENSVGLSLRAARCHRF